MLAQRSALLPEAASKEKLTFCSFLPVMEGNSLYAWSLSLGKLNIIQGFYGLTEKIANFVRLSKDCPHNKTNYLVAFW